MAAKPFEHLLDPGHIGSLALPNRVVMPAMDMNQSVEGEVSPAEIAHYVARAAGGTGLVIMGTGAVAWPVGATSRHQPAFSDDRFIPGLARLADAIHAAGGRICAQLCHHGKTAGIDTAEERPLLVPSVVDTHLDMSALRDSTPDELMRLATATGGRTPTYHEANEEDLAWAIDQFVAAAVRVKAAGLDALEIHAAHGYLISTFLSAGYNRRSDRWGGSIENRSRLACEVVAAVRNAVGPDFPILVRINGHEYGPPGGTTAAEAATTARLLEAAGADAIHVSANAGNPFADFTSGPLPDQVAQYRKWASTVKGAVSIPVIAVGRLLPEVAEEMLAAAQCDFVAMGRQLLADPDLVAKLVDGRPESVRPCINCYVCVEQNFFDATPRCAVNPALGAEERAVAAPPGSSRHVVVVGGGPAGMEAARIAAGRGHRVTLLERGHRLGGTAWLSQLTSPANGPLVDWLVHEVTTAGVDVRLGHAATVDAVKALAPDVVLVATGARRPRPDVPGASLPHVRTGDDLRAMLSGDGSAAVPAKWPVRLALAAARMTRLTGDAGRVRSLSRRWMPIGRDVVVVGGSLVGLELAEFLVERGRRVTVLEEGAAMGLPMAMPRRWTAVRRAAAHGVVLHRSAELLSIGTDAVTCLVDGAELTITASDVIIAGGVIAGDDLAASLGQAGVEVHVVGDAASVGYIEGAIHSAWDALDRI